MKSVLISIKPEWCEKIANGDKTDELRKNAPKLPVPFKCYIYQTKTLWSYPILRALGLFELIDNLEIGKGKVIGEFVCDKIEQIDVDNGKRIEKTSWVSFRDMWKYAHPKSMFDLKAWHISDLVIYDEPKPLSDFYKCGALSPEELDEDLCSHCAATNNGDAKSCYTPNGLQMCEGRWCGDAYQAYLDDEFALTRPPQSWCYVQEV